MPVDRCFLCLRYPEQQTMCKDRSMGRPHKHHWLDRQTIRREFPRGISGRSLRQLLADDRNLVTLRMWHHFQLENRRISIPRFWVPAAAEEFARELGLEWRLDRLYGRMEMTA